MFQVDASHQPELDQIRQNYFDYLGNAIGVFEGAVLCLRDDSICNSALEGALNLAHKIKGNAFMYGFPGLGQKAESVESCLTGGVVEDDVEDALFSLINLISKIEDICSSTSKSEPMRLYPALAVQAEVKERVSQPSSPHLDRKSILLAYQDPWLCDLLQSLLASEYDVFHCHSETDLTAQLHRIKPNILVLEDDLVEGGGIDWEGKAAFHNTALYLAFNAGDHEKVAKAISSGVAGFSQSKLDVLEIAQNVRGILDQPREKVLIVDDDLAVREMLRYHLEGSGLLVDVANDGIEALEYLNDKTPDLIILDRFMPRLEGGTVLYEIQNRVNLKSIPVLILTAMVNRGEATHWFERGAADFIPKPFDPEEVSMRVKQHLESRRRIS